MKNLKSKNVQLRMPPDVLEFLKSRVKGTSITLTTYINAILTVRVIELHAAGREEAARCKARSDTQP